MDLIELSKTAIKAAYAAGEVIRRYMEQDVTVEEKAAGSTLASQVVTVVDRKCEEIILSHLLPTCKAFDIALLSEETTDDGSRFIKHYFWCIDPLDGTLAFINKQPGFSVSIALVTNDGTPLMGVVYDPSRDKLYHAIKSQGVYKNGQPWNVKTDNTHLTYVTDKKLEETPRAAEIKAWLNQKVEELDLTGFKVIAGGGSVINAIRVLENGPACMLKLPKKEVGGGSIWDFAATTCIFQELGLPATQYDGRRLDLNKRDGAFMNEGGVSFSNILLKKFG